MPTISVVIPTFNEQNYLANLLGDLVNQTTPPDVVIVSDCHSGDKTAEIAESFKDRLPIRITESKIRSPGAARNAGARVARSDYLLFTDADIRVPKTFISQILSALKKRKVDFLTPRFESDGLHFVDMLNSRFVDMWMMIGMRVFRKATGIGGAMCIAVDVHKRVGGFNEKLQVQDDVDYIYRLRRAGASYTYLDDLTVINSSRRWQGHGIFHGLTQLLFQNSRLGRFIFTPVLKKLDKHKKYGHYN